MTVDISVLSTRRLQTEVARVLVSSGGFASHDLVKFNKAAHHDSHAWYRSIIYWYVEQYGGLPSTVGPGVSVKLLMDDAR
jgi:hypothetical protein